MRIRKHVLRSVTALAMLSALVFSSQQSEAQQKELGEVNILTAVSNMAFSALWVAEQLKYFEQEGVRAKITPAGGGAPCQNAVVGRSAHAQEPAQRSDQSADRAWNHWRHQSGRGLRTDF